MKHLFFFIGLVALVSGCASYRNPAPLQPPTFSAEELRSRVPLRIGVQFPKLADFQNLPNDFDRQIRYELATNESKRLISILNDCQVVESISSASSESDPYDVILMALPRGGESTGMDDPWLLLYGGALPYYSKDERGISFRFLKGGNGDATFKWTESKVVGIWAPLVSAGGQGWHATRTSGTYWYDLRAYLIQVFSVIPQDKSANNPLNAGRAEEPRAH